MNDAEKFITEVYGKRCKTTDREDFPDTDYDDPKNGRCPTCEMWEIYDEWCKDPNKTHFVTLKGAALVLLLGMVASYVLGRLM